MLAVDREDDLKEKGPEPLTWVIFIAGMAFSAIVSLWFGRNVSFTGDEYSIISLTSDLDPGMLFEPYVGHLMPVSFLAYKAMLEIFGTGNYVYFQLLSLFAIFLMGAGVLYWGCRRLPDAVVLAPSLVLILFTGDLLHYVAGNGFIIVFPLACGIWALNAWERNTRWGDITALALLAIGMMTYTVGVAFAVGILVAALLGDRKRLWVAGAPLIAYALWRLLVASASAEVEDAGPSWVNLLLLPAWIFQGVGGTLEAMLGLGFNFNVKSGLNSDRYLGTVAPVLAVGFFGLILLKKRYGGFTRSFWTVSSIAVALFTSQVLVWGSFGARAEPIEPRYLYPGALVLILIGLELARGLDWNRYRLGLLWGMSAIAIATAISSLDNSVNRIESATNVAKAQATASYILQTAPDPPPFEKKARTNLRASFDPVVTRNLPGLSFEETRLGQLDPKYSRAIDLYLGRSLGLKLKPIGPGTQTGPCEPIVSDPAQGAGQSVLPDGTVVLESSRDLDLAIGRYGKQPAWNIGTLLEGEPAELYIPPDSGTRPWFIRTQPGSRGTLDDLSICRPDR